LIQQQGDIEEQEMYRVFNMGIGMAIVCAPGDVERLTKAMPDARLIGKVVEQKKRERVTIA
jgi:phosphoribosylformylglycinamidine cyclo-ligase